MILMDRDRKDLVIPKSLGNFVTEGGGGGVTPEEAAEIASAVTSEALEEYSIELEVELEEIRDAISGNTDTLLDLATIAAMSIADRVALFDEIFEKASNGEKIYIKGLVQEETIRTAILPLVSYRPETNPVLHQGGNLYFAAKGDTDNVYFHIGLTSEGAIDPTSGNIIKRNIYNLPTASAEVKGGVRIGSGLTMTQDTLSVDTTGLVTDGDLAPFIVQQSANTQDIASLSAATEAISESLGNYATTATTDALSAVTSALTENVDALSAVTSALTENLETLSGGTPTIYSAGTAYTWCVIYDYDTINSLSTNQKKEILSEIKSYGGQGKFTYIRKLGADGRNQFFPQSKLTSTKAEYYSLGGENYDYVTLTSAGLLSNGYKAIYTLPTAAANKKGGVKVGSGLTMNGEVMSVNIGEGLAFSGSTLVVSGGTGGGIEKVSSLPVTAEEGDVVWLEGASRTGYTIVFGENVGDAEWPWGLDQEVFTLDGNSASARYGGWLGRWVKFSVFSSNYAEYSDIMVRPRLASNNAVLDIVIINGSHTIGLGQNGISMTSDVEFPDRGCLYVYTGGKWYSKPTFEWEYNQSEALALLDKIRGGIEDFDADNFVMRYSIYGVSREFKITNIANYGVDFQASDDRGTINGEWGKLNVRNYRIDNNGDISDLVGEHWIVSSDQLPSYDTRIIRIDSAGTVTDADGFELLSNMYGISTRIEFNAEFDNKCNAAPLKWWYRQYEEVGGETKLIYYVCTEIPINGVVYKGIWKSAEYEWGPGLTPTTWTAV